jgi:ABC-type Mn2+/Zn2+ transport system ATPase subunit
MHVLNVENLNFAHKNGTIALRDLSISVTAGSRVLIVGSNGAGKVPMILSHIIPQLIPENSLHYFKYVASHRSSPGFAT